jgi:hypothetical protein
MKVKLMNLEDKIISLADKATKCVAKDALSYSQAALNLAHANSTFNQIELNRKLAEKQIEK